MTAADLLADLTRQGFTLTVEGEGIRVTPRSRLTAGQREAILAHKPALLGLICPLGEGSPCARPSRPSPTATPPPAEALQLLADIRATVERLRREDFRGKPPPLFEKLAGNAVAIAEDHVRNHTLEATRGWDVLELLRDDKRVLLEIAGRISAK
jgi:hypothetical protein